MYVANGLVQMAETFVMIPMSLLARRDLKPQAKLVYGYLSNRQGQNVSAWPSLARIAADCGMSRATAKRTAHQLAEAELIDIDRSGDGRGTTNAYTISAKKGGQNRPKGGQNDGLTGSDSTPLAAKRGSESTEKGGQPDPRIRTSELEPVGVCVSRAHARGHPNPDASDRHTLLPILKSYPKQPGGSPDAALAEIARAVESIAAREHPPPDAAAWLLKRTQAFAEATKGADMDWIPRADNWFRKGRYDDDSDWHTLGRDFAGKSRKSGKPERTTPRRKAKRLN